MKDRRKTLGNWKGRVAPLLMAIGLVAVACGGTAPAQSPDLAPSPGPSQAFGKATATAPRATAVEATATLPQAVGEPSGTLPPTSPSTIVGMPPGNPTQAATPATEPSPTPPKRPPPTGLALKVSAGGVEAIGSDQMREELRHARFYVGDWSTDFRFRTVAYEELRGGGPPKDGIPSIDDPQFESVGSANDWLSELEPVQVVSINGDHRAYPVQIMIWHELVNDVVGGEPVVITY